MEENFAQDILDAVEGEEIEAIALGACRGSSYMGMEPDHDLGSDPVCWEKAKPVLDYKYDSGYGGQDCHDFWLWTKTRVFFVHEYDGATSIAHAPRNPGPFSGATQ